MTTSDSPLDRTNLTFSQAEGLAPLPSQLKLGHLSEELRSIVWPICLVNFEKQAHRTIGSIYTPLGAPCIRYSLVLMYCSIIPSDEFESYLERIVNSYKKLVFDGVYNEVLISSSL